ncbi:hypothetical protein OBCHQ24_03510 [Oceanobacillus iheyensis]|nr:hypothetical protein OBCHQ24_03510 [Oceanobacillus iheyensis]
MFLTIFYHIVLSLLDFSQYNYKITTMAWIHLNSASETTAPQSETTAPTDAPHQIHSQNGHTNLMVTLQC